MSGRETFIVRVAEDAMAPRVWMGDYVWVDPDEPDEPAAHGRLVAVRDPGRGGETVVGLLIERAGSGARRARRGEESGPLFGGEVFWAQGANHGEDRLGHRLGLGVGNASVLRPPREAQRVNCRGGHGMRPARKATLLM